MYRLLFIEYVKGQTRRRIVGMVLAAKAVKDGEADAVLSAGNTGALLAAGFFIVGRIKNIDRPGLMSTLPTVDGKGFDISPGRSIFLMRPTMKNPAASKAPVFPAESTAVGSIPT